MTTKFIVNGYGASGLDDLWVTGYMLYKFSDNTYIKSEECEIYFENYFLMKKWVKEMGNSLSLPEQIRGWKK